MKKLLLITLLATPAFAQHCDLALWKHVYNSKRLKVIKPCTQVSGTVTFMKKEPDGDIHIRLKLDPQFEALLNARNKSVQHGALVIEPVCTKAPKQKDAVGVCKGFQQSFPALKIGAHVTVTGAYVLDSSPNHGWNEIHPISAVK